jgi:nitric oxide reductase NorQ protein
MAGREAAALPVERRFLAATPFVHEVVGRGLTYLRAGLPLHLSGPAGAGKTTVALHLAELLGRPCVFLQGDEQLTSADLVRGPLSVRRSKVVDHYIRSVTRTAEDYSEQWTDGWLATACRNGYTLVYDEFTRSRAEANNVLLSVLEERVLVAPGRRSGQGVIPVHAEFRLILTSNPIEYVGVHRAADALLDRLVTIRLEYYDEETEAAIVRGHTGLPDEDCRRIVALVRTARARTKDAGARPSLRSAVILGRVLQAARLPVDFSDPRVVRMCIDVLAPAVSTPRGLANMVGASARAESREPSEEGR